VQGREEDEAFSLSALKQRYANIYLPAAFVLGTATFGVRTSVANFALDTDVSEGLLLSSKNKEMLLPRNSLIVVIMPGVPEFAHGSRAEPCVSWSQPLGFVLCAMTCGAIITALVWLLADFIE
jgi:hypothetical protein